MSISGMLPRNHGLPGFRLSRGRMLNGSIHCAFGPGQPPNCLDSTGYSRYAYPATDGPATTFSYLNPTDWNRVGTLARVPQVIHVSVTVPWYSASSRSDPNPVVSGYANEYLRIKTQLDSFCSTINALRPGRTWASRVNWLSVPSYEESTVDDGPDTNAPNFSYGQRYLHMLTIPANSQFFGTNYLSIWIGTISFDAVTLPANTVHRWVGLTYGNLSGGVWTPVSILSDGTYTLLSRPCVTTNYPNFARFATWLYGMNIDWGIPGVSMPLWSNQALFDTADDLSGYGFVYQGDNSLVSSANLLSLVSAHFGFDPVTGKDL